jgi:poly-beta-1,6-N-acetyl-D-glucosamine synthase
LMSPKRKKAMIRLRHVALMALIVAIIATFSSFWPLIDHYPTYAIFAKLFILGCMALIAYTYVGYPILLDLMARSYGRSVKKGGVTPSVSVILAAFNEEKVIREKINNLLALDYPEDRLEILIGSDGSDDKTAEIVQSFNNARVQLFDFHERQGKVSVLNRIIPRATGDVLVFTDASEMFDPQAIRHLVSNFADPKVGAVSGQLMMTSEDSNGSSQGVSAYWKYEKFLRARESRLYSMLGATGAIYALRRSLYESPPANTILDDVAIPMAALRQGYRVVFEPEALAFEKATDKARDEFKRKVRTLTGNFQEYFHLERFLDKNTIFVLFQVFSHKILRLVAPFAMLALLFATIFTSGRMPSMLLAAQLVFYSLAFIGLLRSGGRVKLFSIPYMFCVMNFAALVGAFRYFFSERAIAGGKAVLWEKTKEPGISGIDIGGINGSAGGSLQAVGQVVGTATTDRLYFKVKAFIDFMSAAAGLIVASPVMAAVAVAIKLDSKGPAIFKQKRVGLDGRIFTMYKFRSMVVDAEKNTGAVWATKNDPRVTRLGKFIRKTHLDELPQLINVLKGDMSMIGPRPERPDFVRTLNQQIEGYTRRLEVKPGITGLAQVCHKYDETLQDVRMKVKYDVEYIEKASLKTDMYVTLMTARRMVFGLNEN